MSATATLMAFLRQKVASLMRQLDDVQIVATPSRQFRKTNKLQQEFVTSFKIVSTVLTKLARTIFYAPATVAGVSLAFVIGAKDE